MLGKNYYVNNILFRAICMLCAFACHRSDPTFDSDFFKICSTRKMIFGGI